MHIASVVQKLTFITASLLMTSNVEFLHFCSNNRQIDTSCPDLSSGVFVFVNSVKLTLHVQQDIFYCYTPCMSQQFH